MKMKPEATEIVQVLSANADYLVQLAKGNNTMTSVTRQSIRPGMTEYVVSAKQCRFNMMTRKTECEPLSGAKLIIIQKVGEPGQIAYDSKVIYRK